MEGREFIEWLLDTTNHARTAAIATTNPAHPLEPALPGHRGGPPEGEDAKRRRGKLDSEQVHLKQQRRVRRNHTTRTARAVAQLSRDDQAARTAHGHA